eukprot:CAMPEP_0178917904 /NCGR_PEP_ID=MMETSP0786-20121207/13523_1 /TAXON_ID=186022 /ORGANISM="Thalassionema frauenfeldii, Strain CCMP 1798" /LENGTH=262 /DNA_ID=CAMNT_0020591541 /DNA_START=59 /DNA_END=847 /DNA_ORIENTATION=+
MGFLEQTVKTPLKERYFPTSKSYTTNLFGKRMKFDPPSRLVSNTIYIKVQENGDDAWRTMDAVEILQRGGVGIVPTDTGYGFVTPIDSKTGLERLLRIKGLHQCKKPMSLLCSDLSTINTYCYGISKHLFRILKKNLPGSYTFILPAKTTLPNGIIFDSKGYKHSWKRQTLGVRIPNDPVLRYLQDDLLEKTPLLVSSLPLDEDEGKQLLNCSVDEDASWCKEVDFIIDGGHRPYDGSTVFDMTTNEPELLREGIGKVELSM